MQRFPELRVAGDEHLAVDIRVHEGAFRPDEIIMLDHHLDACLCPGLHVMARIAVEAVKDRLHPGRIGGTEQQHLPAEGGDGARDDRPIVATRGELVRPCLPGIPDELLIGMYLGIELRQPVLRDGIEGPHLLHRLEGAARRRAPVAPIGGVHRMTHVRDAAAHPPVCVEAIVGAPEEVHPPELVESLLRLMRCGVQPRLLTDVLRVVAQAVVGVREA